MITTGCVIMLRLTAIWRHFSQAVLRNRGWLPEKFKTEPEAKASAKRAGAAERGAPVAKATPKRASTPKRVEPEAKAAPKSSKVFKRRRKGVSQVPDKSLSSGEDPVDEQPTGVVPATAGADVGGKDADEEAFDSLFGGIDDTCNEVDKDDVVEKKASAESSSSSSSCAATPVTAMPGAAASSSSSGGSPTTAAPAANSNEFALVPVATPPPSSVVGETPHDARDFWQTAAAEMDAGELDDNLFSCFDFMSPPGVDTQDALKEHQTALERDRQNMPPPKALPITYAYGYDDTQGKAFRKPIKQPRAPPEWADDIIVNKMDPDTAPAIAVFSDGSRWAIAMLTKGDLNAKRGSLRPRKLQAPEAAGKGKKGNKSNIFDGQHTMTQGRVRVVWLKAESLWSLKVKHGKSREAQICQCSEQSTGNKEVAGQILTTVAKEYCENKHKDNELYERRDVLKREWFNVRLPSGTSATSSSAPGTAERTVSSAGDAGASDEEEELECDDEGEEEEESDAAEADEPPE